MLSNKLVWVAKIRTFLWLEKGQLGTVLPTFGFATVIQVVEWLKY